MKHPIDHQRDQSINTTLRWLIIAAVILAVAALLFAGTGCRQLLYTDAERDAAYLGRDAAQHLHREDPTDFRRQTVAGALDASVSRLGRPDQIPPIPQWSSPEVAIRKEVVEKIEQGKQDAKRDRGEVVISQAKATADKVAKETEGIPLIPGILGGASVFLGTLGLAWRKVRKVRREAQKPLDNIVKAVDGIMKPMKESDFDIISYVKNVFKIAAIPELNAAVERNKGRK